MPVRSHCSHWTMHAASRVFLTAASASARRALASSQVRGSSRLPSHAAALPPRSDAIPFSTDHHHHGHGHSQGVEGGSGDCARVRPGDHGLPIVYHPAYSKPVMPENHRFPMPVFRAIYRRLISDGVAVPGKNLFQPARMPSEEELAAAHCEDYVNAFCVGTLDDSALRKIGLPWSDDLVERTLAEVSGTILTADLALAAGVAVNTAGGTHHAHRDHGSGFCIFNDLAITAKRVLARGAVDRVLIVDLDVHQGDGTARILADDPRAYTLSVHCEENFPREKASSDRDVGLPQGTGDDEYVRVTQAALRESLEEHKPGLVLYDAGVDVHEADGLGGLKLTDEGLIRREALVLDTCVGMGVPVAAYVGGGYDRNLDALARRHCILHHVAREIFESNRL